MLDYLTFNPGGTSWWRRVRWWAWVLVALYGVAFYAWGWVPLQYAQQTKAPPLEQLTRTEGTVFFIKNKGKRGGYKLGLETQAGQVLFNCGSTLNAGAACVLTTLVKELSGKPGSVWWYAKPYLPGRTRNYAMQIEVAGKTIRSYQKGLWYIERAKSNAKLDMGHLAVFLTILAAATIYKGVRKDE